MKSPDDILGRPGVMSKDKQLVIIWLLALTVTLGSISKLGAIAPGTKVRLEPVNSVVGLNETFAAQVMIEEVNDLGAFQFEVAYDSSILQVKEAALGDFLGSTGRSVVSIGPEVDNEEGRVTFGAISLGSGPGPSGTGVLATITCIAQGKGSTVLELREVQVLNTMANAQLITVEGGQVVVRGAAAPTPVATATSAPTDTATPEPTSTPEAVATPTPAATALPSPTPSVTGLAAETPTRAPSPSPTPSVTSPTVETATEALAPSPTPSITSPSVETPTKAPPPSPTPSLSIVPTETRPTEVTTPLAVPSVEATQSPVAATTAPTSTPSTLPSPSPTSRPSPTPLATIPTPAPTGLSGWVVLGPLLAALAVVILTVLILRRRPEG
jgi:hypothetical protein